MMFEHSTKVTILCAGILFLTGLITGVWKYWQMSHRAEGFAHPYVDIAHRSALMYSFASILLAVFTVISQLENDIELFSVIALELFFMLAVGSYILHGWLQDTDNQLEKPHKLGKRTLPASLMKGFMWSLIIAEIGGFCVLFYAVCMALFKS